MRNRFKGLDLIDRVPDDLWNEGHDIVQETGIKTIPMEKKCRKAKWLSEEALKIAVKRREAKSKGENEKYKHLIDFLVYWIRYLKCMPTLCSIKSEFGFLRLVLSLRSRSLTKALLWTSAGEDPRSCLTSIL